MEYKSNLTDNVVYLYIDESQVGEQNKPGSSLYLCISLILSEDKDDITSKLKETKKIFTNDQFMGVRKNAVNKLLHYNDDNDEVKLKFTDIIRMMFFKSYIATKKFNDDGYDNIYFILLKKLLKDRIVKYKDRVVVIRYEQNSKISEKGFVSVVDGVLESIQKDNKYVIKTSPIIEETTKDDVLVSIPDYSLGLFLTYKKEKENENTAMFKIIRFEKIRSKIRLFIDLDSSSYYSRKSGNHI